MGAIKSTAADFERKNIYRVFRLGRFLELLNQQANTLVRPSLWEDPWEEWWFSIKSLLQIGAYPCFVLGAYWTACLLWEVPRPFPLPLIIYTLLAFVPFITLVYPRVKTRQRLVMLSSALIEIAILGLFVYGIFFSTL
jgi:hypothetical protein